MAPKKDKKGNAGGMFKSVGWQHLCMFLQACSIIAGSYLLAGCVSDPNTYVLDLSYSNDTSPFILNPLEKQVSTLLNEQIGSSELQVRTSYFHMCVRNHRADWKCSRNDDYLAEQFGLDQDPLDLVGAVSEFRDEVLTPWVLVVGIALEFLSIVLFATFPGWKKVRDHETGEVRSFKPSPKKFVVNLAWMFSFLAFVLTMVNAVWQLTSYDGARAMIRIAFEGNVRPSQSSMGQKLPYYNCFFAGQAAMWFTYYVVCIFWPNELAKCSDHASKPESERSLVAEAAREHELQVQNPKESTEYVRVHEQETSPPNYGRV
ncbi:hypothetical protein DM02DRAFT_666530 [Periconia macrospinosa]|uniref:Uncharacterized protein n=1 Tax=Periconia macrospinosa TaxID=97972 RepID=A0A2V1ED56_9PLEO|nr:hypothetical protein DM02DRAFT_666530 [Periconia macrospinosa]